MAANLIEPTKSTAGARKRIGQTSTAFTTVVLVLVGMFLLVLVRRIAYCYQSGGSGGQPAGVFGFVCICARTAYIWLADVRSQSLVYNRTLESISSGSSSGRSVA